MRALILVAAAAMLAACGPKVITKEVQVITYVPIPTPCPATAERARLKALRPVPLRNQLMPATSVERNAKAQAQLGTYEAEGGYADQVDTALDRCQKP